MYKKGDLVVMTNHVDEMLTGLILDIHIWNPEDDEVDIYVHWSNGETYWCCVDAVKLA